jgi:hypothetical protein
MASAPTSVQKLPVTTVNSHRVPGVSIWLRWRRALTLLERSMTIAFSVASNNHALKTSSVGNSFVGLGITCAYSSPGKYGVFSCHMPYVVAEERSNIIVNVIMEPGEDCPRLVRI